MSNNLLGKELNTLKQSLQSKSSIMHEDMDQRKLMGLIEDKDRTIRKLTKKIQKLEQTLKRTMNEKNIRTINTKQDDPNNVHLQLLMVEMEKNQKLEEIIKDITERVNSILEELSQDNTITENSQEIREILHMMEVSRNQSFSSDAIENEMQRSLNISSQCAKKIDLVEGAFKSLRNKFKGSCQTNKSLAQINEGLKQKLEILQLKQKDNEEAKILAAELKEEKKQKEKLKKLLQKTEFEKNELINKINASGMKDADVKAKTKEELLQYSKELHYRVKDLQKQKESILKEATRDKEQDLRKYQTILRKLKTIKQKSFLGKSCA